MDPDHRLVAAALARRWELALRALAEAREAAQRFAQTPPEPTLDPTLRAQLADLSTGLPELWRSGRLTPAQQKELLRSLIRRVILDCPQPDAVTVKVVWVSGAVSLLTVQPPIQRAVDVADHAPLVAQILALRREGHQEEEIARRLTAAGFRSARSPHIPVALVGKVCRAHGLLSLVAQFRQQAKIDGQWTVWGLSRALHVTRNWLYTRITKGTVPATRHAATGHYLIADDPALLAQLKAQVPASRRT